jgi:3-dehydroquinate synthetase
LLAALRLSGADELRAEVKGILDRHQLPVEMVAEEDDIDIWVNGILDVLQFDKKRTAAGVGFVLLREPGNPEIGQIIEEAKVRAAVKELFK